MAQAKAGTGGAQTGLVSGGGVDLTLSPQPMKAGACYWQVGA